VEPLTHSLMVIWRSSFYVQGLDANRSPHAQCDLLELTPCLALSTSLCDCSPSPPHPRSPVPLTADPFGLNNCAATGRGLVTSAWVDFLPFSGGSANTWHLPDNQLQDDSCFPPWTHLLIGCRSDTCAEDIFPSLVALPTRGICPAAMVISRGHPTHLHPAGQCEVNSCSTAT
jgi:hypothetical protein